MKVDDCIFFQLAKASQNAVAFWNQKVAHLDITATQAMVLNFLGHEDEITAHALGEKLKITSATMTGILDRLEKMNLIERRPKPDDRRAILICLTDPGANIANELQPLSERANEEFLQTLSPEEETLFRGLLKRLQKD